MVPFDGHRGGAVVHNGGFDTGDRRVQYKIRGDAPPHRLTAEPFPQLLAFLVAGGWTPDGTARPTVRPDPVAVPAVIAPWMSERLGTGLGFALYAWVTGLLASRSPRHRPYISRGQNGVRYLAATREELAVLTKLSPATVKRGLRHTREAGLVYTRRGDGRTFLVVVPPEEAGG